METLADGKMYRLNPEKIREIIHQQGLKYWWVAEFAGVHKTTLRRWLSGRVKRARACNIINLAKILESPERVIVFAEG